MKFNYILIFGLILIMVIFSCTKKGSGNYNAGGLLPSKNIAIIQGKFNPEDISFPRGNYVTFSNLTDQNHTLCSSDLITIDSVVIEKGKSFTLHFQNAGVYQYHCIEHNEQGVIRVEN